MPDDLVVKIECNQRSARIKKKHDFIALMAKADQPGLPKGTLFLSYRPTEIHSDSTKKDRAILTIPNK